MAEPERQGGSEVVEKPKSVTKRPQLYHVVLINDDYTTMEFVVRTLEEIFDKGPAEAYRIMMEVHTHGRGICGAYTFEVASEGIPVADATVLVRFGDGGSIAAPTEANGRHPLFLSETSPAMPVTVSKPGFATLERVVAPADYGPSRVPTPLKSVLSET